MSTIEARLTDVDKRIHEAAQRGVRLAAHFILGEARKRVPWQEGDLERSGAVIAEALVAAVVFDTPYAVAQHENPHYSHDNGRTWKYLESVVNEHRDEVAKIIRDEIARVFRG